MKHVVTVTYSDPTHDFMSMKGRTKSTNYVVEARNVNEAQLRASSYFRSMGYKIHSATIVEQKKEVSAAPAVLKEEAEQVAEVNARYNMTQALTPKGSNVKAADGTTARDKAATNKYARRISKLTGGEYSKQDVKDNLKSLATEETQYIEEKLSASDGVDKWIHDFVHSDNPKFEGKSKKERIQQALGAYYAAKRGTNEEVTPGAKGKITHIVVKDKLQAHADEMDSEGYDTHTKELPVNHPKAKTHIGIVAQSPVEGDYHESMGHAEPIHEGSMSPAVKAAQAKFDAQTKAQQKKPVQAGTLAAKARREAQVAEGAEDPSNILSVIKAAAKSKTLAKQASPKIELGLSKDNPVNEKGPKDEDITEAVEGKETDGRESKTEVKNKEAKSTEKETAVAKAKDENVKKKKNPVVINPEAKHAGVGSMSINTMAVGGSSGSTGGGGYAA